MAYLVSRAYLLKVYFISTPEQCREIKNRIKNLQAKYIKSVGNVDYYKVDNLQDVTILKIIYLNTFNRLI